MRREKSPATEQSLHLSSVIKTGGKWFSVTGLPQARQDKRRSGIFVKIQGPFPDIRSYSCIFLGRLKEHRTITPENFSSTSSLTFTNLCDKGLILNRNSIALSLIEKEEREAVLPWLIPSPSHPTSASGFSVLS